GRDRYCAQLRINGGRSRYRGRQRLQGDTGVTGERVDLFDEVLEERPTRDQRIELTPRRDVFHLTVADVLQLADLNPKPLFAVNRHEALVVEVGDAAVARTDQQEPPGRRCQESPQRHKE